MNKTYIYTLRLADNSLILGQRLGEWCGHGPVLEQDIALTNLSLDLIGQARLLYQYAAKIKGGGISEDDIAYLRKEHEYFNVLLVEQPNGDFAHTIARQFFCDVFNYFNFEALIQCKDKQLTAIAAKSLKEVKYHLRFSSEWMLRLGDGTEESHNRLQSAVDKLWTYTGELFLADEVDVSLTEKNLAPDLSGIQEKWLAKVSEIMQKSTLRIPEVVWMQRGGKQGVHTEYMGYILAELQYMQRTYPGLTW